jgi:cell division protein FtsZ
MMGTGEGSGERRAIEAAEAAISNPLLDEVSMRGARGVLINITGGHDMTLFEVDEAANRIKEEVDPDANIIVGSTLNETLDGEMRVSVVATGIEARGAAAAAVMTEVPASKPSTLSMPSFRLRAQPAKAASGAGVPVKSAPARSSFAPDDGSSEARGSGAGRERDQVDSPLRPGLQPTEAEIAHARQSSAAEPGFWHPPLPPQERFQEWGKLRAPVRGAERPPSLFERVTASFRNREREGDPEAGRPRPEMAEPALATAEEDPYDVPAFLRR